MTSSSLRGWHWPHLLLLAAWPAWTVIAIRADMSVVAATLAWLAFCTLLLAAAERWRPYRRDWLPSRSQLRRDGSVWSLNLVADGATGALVAAIAIHVAARNPWPLLPQVIAGILAAELGSYWLHRWSHAGGWLWRVHLLHHRPERMNTANALTAHPINAIYNHLARTLPMVALGLGAEAILAVALFGISQSLVTHANVAGGIGWLEWLVGNAGQHRLHHSTDETQAGNFGTTVPLWDQVFGTWRRDSEPTRVGVFTPDAYPGELDLGPLLCWPLPARLARCRHMAETPEN